MISGSINLAWSVIERYLPKKEEPQNSLEHEDRGVKIKYIEQENYYERKTQQSCFEAISQFCTLVTSCLSIYFSPSIVCLAALCAIFQFLIGLTKAHCIDVIEKKCAKSLQDKIAKIDSPSNVFNPMFSCFSPS